MLSGSEKGGVGANLSQNVLGLKFRGGFFERDSGVKTSGRPQVNLRSRAPVPGRHWSGCTPRPIEFEHRALDLRFSPTIPVQKTSLRSAADADLFLYGTGTP